MSFLKKICDFSQFQETNENDGRYELYLYLEESMKNFILKNINNKVEYLNTKNKINCLYEHIMVEIGSLFESKLNVESCKTGKSQVDSKYTSDNVENVDELVNFEDNDLKNDKEMQWKDTYSHIKKRHTLYKKSCLSTIKPSTWGLGFNSNISRDNNVVTAQLITKSEDNKVQTMTSENSKNEDFGVSKSAHKEMDFDNFFEVRNM